MRRTVDAAAGREVAWRNGLGTTRELARGPEGGDPDGWSWRLSLATSDGPAPFSTFPGVQRELLVVRGVALELRFATGHVVRLGPGESHRFAGDVDVVGAPVGGATRQLNLMWHPEAVRAELVRGPVFERAGADTVTIVGLDLELHARITPVDAPACTSPARKPRR